MFYGPKLATNSLKTALFDEKYRVLAQRAAERLFRGGFFCFAERARARRPRFARQATRAGLKTTPDAQKRRKEVEFSASERVVVPL